MQVTSGLARQWMDNRLWSKGGEETGARIGTQVSFTLGVSTNFRLEARNLVVLGEKKEVSVIASPPAPVDREVVEVEVDMGMAMAVQMEGMDAVALSAMFDTKLRQRLVTLVHQSSGAILVTALVRRAAILGQTVAKLETNVAHMLMTNFLGCCSSKEGCGVVQVCLETFSREENRVMVAEQLLELESVEQFTGK